MAKKIDIGAIKPRIGSSYPAQFNDARRQLRERQALGKAARLTQFGVNRLRLPPGAWSSLRHWHSKEDEFVFVLEGEAVLVSEDGEAVMRAGECAGFKAGRADGHHLQNRSKRDAIVLEIGGRDAADRTTYSDLDFMYDGDRALRKNGAPLTRAKAAPRAASRKTRSPKR